MVSFPPGAPLPTLLALMSRGKQLGVGMWTPRNLKGKSTRSPEANFLSLFCCLGFLFCKLEW